ncbi:MAG: NusG domain II-containing protein [Chitinispirillaceae bacterium]|nr:NusG domain II-containing protein [Chitinispirillaceae bacterium]
MTRLTHLRSVPRRMTIADVFLIILLLASGALFIPLTASTVPASAVVYRDNRIIAQYPLSSPADVVVKGGNGDVTLRIGNGGIAVVSSRCPRQICRHTGSISRPFEQIICVPNHLLIELRSSDKREIDAITR